MVLGWTGWARSHFFIVCWNRAAGLGVHRGMVPSQDWPAELGTHAPTHAPTGRRPTLRDRQSRELAYLRRLPAEPDVPSDLSHLRASELQGEPDRRPTDNLPTDDLISRGWNGPVGPWNWMASIVLSVACPTPTSPMAFGSTPGSMRISRRALTPSTTWPLMYRVRERVEDTRVRVLVTAS